MNSCDTDVGTGVGIRDDEATIEAPANCMLLFNALKCSPAWRYFVAVDIVLRGGGGLIAKTKTSD